MGHSITENVSAEPLDGWSGDQRYHPAYGETLYQGGANGEQGAFFIEMWRPPALSVRRRIIIHCIRFLERLL